MRLLNAAFGAECMILTTGPAGSLTWEDAADAYVDTVGPVLEEYAGTNTVRCVVRQRGQLGQLRFTCRWFFYSGRQDVTVDFRLENPNPYGLFAGGIPDGEQHFDMLYLVQPVIGNGNYTLTTDATAPRIAITPSR